LVEISLRGVVLAPGRRHCKFLERLAVGGDGLLQSRRQFIMQPRQCRGFIVIGADVQNL